MLSNSWGWLIPGGRRLGALMLIAATACQLLPGNAPTPFATVEPTAGPTASPPTEALAPTRETDGINLESAADLFVVATISAELAGELAWSPDGRQLALTTIHGVGLFDSETLAIEQSFESSVTPLSIAYSSDGTYLVTGGRDLPDSEQDTVTIWDIATGDRMQALTGHTDWVNSVAFDPSGSLVASGSDDTSVRLWRVDIGAEAATLVGHSMAVTSVSFAPDGQILASGSLDGSIRLWRVSDGSLVLQVPFAAGVRSVAFSPDGVTLVAGYEDGSVRLWAAGTGTLLHALTGHSGSVARVAFSPGGDLVVSAGSDRIVRIWSATDGAPVATLEGHTGPVTSVAFSPDGTRLASGSLDGRVRLWGLTAPQIAAGTAEVGTEPVAHYAAGTPVELSEIHMLTDRTGWGLTADPPHVLKTQDGGVSWNDITPPERVAAPGETARMAAGFFLEPSIGWVVYFPEQFVGGPETFDALSFWLTTDGSQWEPGSIRAPMDINDGSPIVRFVDPSHGWILVPFSVGAGQRGYTMVRTSDGGLTWESVQIPPDSLSPCAKTAVEFADPFVGWMTNECPFELGGSVSVDRTSDGGLTWQAHELLPPAGQAAFADTYTLCRTHSPNLRSATQGALVVECTRPSGGLASFLYRTQDAGNTWQISAYPGGELQLIDDTLGWALSREIHKTENGGQTWRLIKTVVWEGQFSFVNADLGWAVARSRDALALVRTTNGGRTFTLLEPVIAP